MVRSVGADVHARVLIVDRGSWPSSPKKKVELRIRRTGKIGELELELYWIDESGGTGSTIVDQRTTMDLTLLFILAVLLGQEVTGLKLLGINVPVYSLRGKSALLECRYDLETDKLYSITWYKDHEEFYRYVPRGEPKKHTYHVEGVKVDYRRSDHQQVLLQNVSLYTSGKYKCEVITEAPSFNAVNAEANMEIVVLPQEGPLITGEEKIYASGDILGLNCTSGKSHPASTFKWFINGKQVKPDTEMVFEQHGLYSVISSLRLQLEPNHFAGDKINVRCEATVELDSNSDALLLETRTTEVFVAGHATTLASAVCRLTVVSALLAALLV